MERLHGNQWADGEAAARYTRGRAAYPTALAWLGVLLAALILAGLAAYQVYRGFAGVYGE
jgi:hypothetical protein